MLVPKDFPELSLSSPSSSWDDSDSNVKTSSSEACAVYAKVTAWFPLSFATVMPGSKACSAVALWSDAVRPLDSTRKRNDWMASAVANELYDPPVLRIAWRRSGSKNESGAARKPKLTRIPAPPALLIWSIRPAVS